MNFANILSIWDRVFGTYYNPSDREPRNFGLDGVPMRENYLTQLVSPFQPTRRPERIAHLDRPVDRTAVGIAGQRARS